MRIIWTDIAIIVSTAAVVAVLVAALMSAVPVSNAAFRAASGSAAPYKVIARVHSRQHFIAGGETF